MFNLEQSISQWRRQMQSAGIKNPEILDELESHLREDLARRIQSGDSEERAFAAAAQDVGEPGFLKHEFAKLGRSKPAWLTKIKSVFIGAFAPVPNFSAFTPGAVRTMELARLEAPRLQHDFIGTEHVLLGLLALEDGAVPKILNRLGVNRDSLKQQIHNWVSNFPPAKTPGPLPYTPRVLKALRLASREAKISSRPGVRAEHIFLGLLLEGDGVAARVLTDLGLTPERIRNEIKRTRLT